MAVVICYSRAMRWLSLLGVMGVAVLSGCSSGVYLEQTGSAPDLSAPNQYGNMVSLREACSGPWAVIFFYPEADTPG